MTYSSTSLIWEYPPVAEDTVGMLDLESGVVHRFGDDPTVTACGVHVEDWAGGPFAHLERMTLFSGWCRKCFPPDPEGLDSES